jgi:hypothetical protein
MNKEDEIIGKITQGKISIKQARKLLKQYAQQRESNKFCRTRTK